MTAPRAAGATETANWGVRLGVWWLQGQNGWTIEARGATPYAERDADRMLRMLAPYYPAARKERLDTMAAPEPAVV